jgi:hypothetical protein
MKEVEASPGRLRRRANEREILILLCFDFFLLHFAELVHFSGLSFEVFYELLAPSTLVLFLAALLCLSRQKKRGEKKMEMS